MSEKAFLSISALSLLDIFLFTSRPFLLRDSFLLFPFVVSFLVSSQVFVYRSYNELLAFCNSLRLGLISGMSVNRRDQLAVLNVRMDMHIRL